MIMAALKNLGGIARKLPQTLKDCLSNPSVVSYGFTPVDEHFPIFGDS